ncbi:unnamed protein product [Arctia plantaginis]|uniref:Secreted protein n=1 Tax=Arctia plantaginis TaxID=874455 RepID=A0A8S1AM90_ARCPL|nr:unnamed protein product [Arctia plantaginis]CAB3247757.1 unnamed protein product [Arctia plantaginis]
MSVGSVLVVLLLNHSLELAKQTKCSRLFELIFSTNTELEQSCGKDGPTSENSSSSPGHCLDTYNNQSPV